MLYEVITNYDLELSGLFRPIDPEAFLEDAGKLGLTSAEVAFGEWRLLGAEVVLKGGYQLKGGELVLELRLFDTVKRRMLAGRRYVGTRGDLRRMAHSFADEVSYNFV